MRERVLFSNFFLRSDAFGNFCLLLAFFFSPSSFFCFNLCMTYAYAGKSILVRGAREWEERGRRIDL